MKKPFSDMEIQQLHELMIEALRRRRDATYALAEADVKRSEALDAFIRADREWQKADSNWRLGVLGEEMAVVERLA